jgi:hypothetical protein
LLCDGSDPHTVKAHAVDIVKLRDDSAQTAATESIVAAARRTAIFTGKSIDEQEIDRAARE